MVARWDEDRVKAALGTAALQLLFAYALLTGLAVEMPGGVGERLRVFAVAPPQPPPPAERVVPRRTASERPAGGSPPNLRARPSEVVAPEPVVPLRLPPPVVAAPVPDFGGDRSAGDADVPGPGTGRGGEGSGTGTGRGDDDGDDAGGGTPPRWLRGRIGDRDYPRWAWEAGIGGTVSVRYRVGTDGRVSDCLATRSSGSPELDALTCRLIEQRFRFAPSRDRTGRAVRSIIVEDHSWMVSDEEGEEWKSP